jgi:cytochrome c peroxidase
VAALASYDRREAILTPLETDDWRILEDESEVTAIAETVDIAPVFLGEDDLAALVAFLESLTDAAMRSGRLGVPDRVPSGLEVAHK